MSFQYQTVENIPVTETTYVYQTGGSFGGNAVVSGGETVTTTYTYTTESSSSSGVVGGSSSSGNLVLGGAGSAGGVTLSSSGNLGGGVVFVSGGGSSNALASGSASASSSALASGSAQQAASSIAGDLLSLGIAGGAAGAGAGAGAGVAGGNTTVTVISSQSGSAVGGGSVDVVSLGGGAVGSSSGSSLDASFISQVEQAIVRATNPIDIQETETITVNGQTGIWANKQEVLNFRGVIPITQYVINEDSNPEIITKRTGQVLTYEQEVAIRYLRPPTPPPPGEIIIRQERNIATAPAPPLVIRQQPPRPETPAPLVIREAPPRPPAAIGQKVITISGKRLPPAPRKVVIERLAPIPAKPQSYIIERWLPYSSAKRRVIFQKSNEADPIVQKPRNIIVQWEKPEVRIRKEFKDLGIIRANPVEYVQRYGATLKQHIELPDFVREIRPPTGVVLASEYNVPSFFELEGDVQALSLIDLDREGLGEYRSLLAKFLAGGSGSATTTVTTVTSGGAGFGALAGAGGAGTLAGALAGAGGAGTLAGALGGAAGGAGASFSGVSGGSSVTFVSSGSNISFGDLLNTLIVELFGNVDVNSDAKVTIGEAENLVIRLNNRLGRSYTKEDAAAFFKRLDLNRDGFVSFREFRAALLNEFTVRA